MEKIYWQFPFGTISYVESQITWFKENNEKLEDYLFDEERYCPVSGGNSRIGEVRDKIETYWTFRIVKYKDGIPINIALPPSIQEKVIDLLKEYVVISLTNEIKE